MLEIAKDKLKALILLGETKYDIKNTADKLGIESIVVNNLEEALNLSKDISVIGDNVLLSPACASWDMYSSYEERGKHFKELVMNLNEKNIKKLSSLWTWVFYNGAFVDRNWDYICNIGIISGGVQNIWRWTLFWEKIFHFYDSGIFWDVSSL